MYGHFYSPYILVFLEVVHSRKSSDPVVGNDDTTEMQSLPVLGVIGRANTLIHRLTGAIMKALFYFKDPTKV